MGRTRRGVLLLLGAGSAGALALLAGRSPAGRAPAREVAWEDLVPAPDAALARAAPRGVVEHEQIPRPAVPPATGTGWSDPGPGSDPFGGSTLKALQPAGSGVVAALDGERVRLRGFVVPVGFDGARVREFLLVPYVGACIHVPPPPANQIVFIRAAEPFEIGGTFTAVAVTGTLRTEAMSNEIASFGYQLAAEQVEQLSAKG